MNDNDIKISCCILSRNDSQFIKDCVTHVEPYVDEILVLDASDDNRSEEIIKRFSHFIPKPIIYKRTVVSENFSKDRNDIQSMVSGDYVLHIDCDERFDPNFLSKMRSIITEYLKNKILPIMFRFPRINLPDKINYPDYQIRLLYKKYTTWKKMTHETPYIIGLSNDPRQEIGMTTINLITLDYPITHLYKDKSQIQKRWNDIVNIDPSRRRKKLLVLSIFKNSSMWIRDILSYMNNLYQFNESLKDDDDNKLDIYFSFIDGQSSDDTFSILESFCREGPILDIQLRQFEPNFGPNDKFVRFKKLATVRNHLIERSIDQLYLNDEDYILFTDSDIIFDKNIIYGLIKDMESSKADIIAPMIYIENFREYGNGYFYDILAFRSIDGVPFSHSNPYFPTHDINRPNEVCSVGSFYIMKYKVAKKVKFTGEYDSEQVEFCNRARSQGFKIFISPRLSVQHINFDKYNIPWH